MNYNWKNNQIYHCEMNYNQKSDQTHCCEMNYEQKTIHNKHNLI